MTCPQAPTDGGPFVIHAYDEWTPGDKRWGSREGDVWPEGMPKPRTCGYCGGAHPDDVLNLIALGWELDPSTKGYKSYIQPPGYHAGWANIREGKAWPIKSPVPPVKLYGWHLDEAQVTAVNDAIRKQRDEQRNRV